MSLEAVNIVLPDKRDQGKVCFIVKNVFSPEECQELIDYSESIGYVPALLNNGSSESLELDIRNSWRVIADDHTRAANIYERIKQFLPKSIVDKYTDKKYEPVSVNERLRFLKYEAAKNHYFKPHYDGCFARKDSNERSFLTIQIYLTDNLTTGGATRFLAGNPDVPSVDIQPEKGLVVVFDHRILHEGCPLTSGTKYTIRSDVMYAPAFIDL